MWRRQSRNTGRGDKGAFLSEPQTPSAETTTRLLSFKVETDLLSAGEPVGQLLQAAHHSLIPEVVREGLRPLRQQLEDLWGDFPDSLLKTQHRIINTNNNTTSNIVPTAPRGYCRSYLVGLGVAQPLLLHAQVTHLRHQLIWVHEETRAEQEGENVRSLRRHGKTD